MICYLKGEIQKKVGDRLVFNLTDRKAACPLILFLL